MLVCWLILSSCYRLSAPPWAANFSVLVFVIGGGLFHSGTYESCFTHIYSALGLSLLVWLWLRGETSWVTYIAFGLTCFFLVEIRNTNLIPVGLLAAAGLSVRRWKKPVMCQRIYLFSALGTVAACLLQVAYNSHVVGHLTLEPTSGKAGFLWNRPMQWPVMFSYKKGLFTYYPVLAAGLLAGFLAPRIRPAASWVSAIVGAYVILYGFFAVWYLGGGMGHRGFIDLMPLPAILFAVALPELQPKPRKWIMVGAALAAFATLQVMAGYWSETFLKKVARGISIGAIWSGRTPGLGSFESPLRYIPAQGRNSSHVAGYGANYALSRGPVSGGGKRPAQSNALAGVLRFKGRTARA